MTQQTSTQILSSGSLEQRMLSGKPFTYAMLCSEFGALDRGLLVDRTIQKYRRRGLISYTRDGRRIVWNATAEGLAAASRGIL